MKYELRCTVHNFEFGFNATPPGIAAALLKCPLCAEEELRSQQASLEEVRAHRELLLQAIDLKRTVLRRRS
jgi:hypothetical protein